MLTIEKILYDMFSRVNRLPCEMEYIKTIEKLIDDALNEIKLIKANIANNCTIHTFEKNDFQGLQKYKKAYIHPVAERTMFAPFLTREDEEAVERDLKNYIIHLVLEPRTNLKEEK